MKSSSIVRFLALVAFVFSAVLGMAQTPTVSAINPATATVGTVVTITGTNLSGTTGVTFGGVAGTGVQFDAGSGTVKATVPATAKSGPVVVTTPGGTAEFAGFTVALSLTANPTHTVVTPGQAAGFSVTAAGGAQNSTYTFQWRKGGTDISGATNRFLYFPAVDEALAGDYDVVVSDGTQSITSPAFAIRLAGDDVWTWRNRLPTGNDLGEVAFGAGRYVAVGWGGTILTSTDGLNWAALPQRPPVALLHVVFNGSHFLALGTGGNLLRSADGLNWTQHSVGMAVNLVGAVYASGKWVVVGGAGSVFTSADGLTWVRQNTPTTATIQAVTATPSGFMAATYDGQLLTSDAAATTWTAGATLAPAELNDLVYHNGVYLITGAGRIARSTDGINWTNVTIPIADNTVFWTRLVATGAGFHLSGAGYASRTNNPRGYVLHSTDGSTWTERTIPGSPGLEGITHGAAGYVSVGLLGQISHSADGVTWTGVTTGFATPGDLLGGATGPAGSLFVGHGGVVLRSTDHLTGWARVDLGTGIPLGAATYAAGRYVVVGGNTSTTAPQGYVASSETGAAGTWTAVTFDGPSNLNAVAYDARVGRFIAAGDGGSLYWATNPAGTWTAVSKGVSETLRAGAAANGRYVFVGDGGRILTSTDGNTWNTANSGTLAPLAVVTWGNGRWVAAGVDLTGGSQRSVFVTSTDGVNWTPVVVPYNSSIRGITYADGRFVTVGGLMTVLTSTDGFVWDAHSSEFSGLFRSILRTPAGLLVGGTGGAIASLDAPTATQAVAQRTLGVGTTTAFVPVTGGGSHAPFTYSVTPSLPPGLVFDAATGAVSGAPTTAALTPLFAGTDDFNAGSDAKWAYFFRLPAAGTNGEITFTNGRLDFAKGTGFGTYFLGWDGDRDGSNTVSRTSASLVTSWNFDLTVTNTYTAASGEYADLGIEVAGANTQWAMIRLISRDGNRYVRAMRVGGTATEAPVTATTVRLRLAWDAAAKSLAAQYSTDAGATFTTLATYAPATEWVPGSINGGFFFEVVAESNAAGAIAAGGIYGDDLVIAATSPAAVLHTVTVTNEVGLRTNNNFLLTIVPAPAITGISPATPAPGAVVTISGTDLAGVTGVTVNGVAATNVSYDPTAKTISATLPSGARSGPVVVTTATGSSTGFNLTVPLVITSPPNHTVVTSGQAASFGVVVAGGAPGTYTYQWRRNGQPITGATRQFLYFPAVNESHEGEYDAVISVGSETVTTGLAALRTASPDLWTWRNRLPVGSDLTAVAYGAGRYVAVGYSGTLLSSTDGITWQPQRQRPPTAFFNVVHNGTEFMVLGGNGNVLRSNDGLDWTEHPIGSPSNFRGLAYAFGKWVATGTGGAIFTSTDGTAWTIRTSGVSSTINAVRATADGFMAVTTGGQVLTTDANASTWTIAATLTGESLVDLGFANGTWVIAANGKVLTSTNGTTWTAATLPTSDPGISWNRVVVNSDGFTIAGASYVTTSPTPRGYMIHSANGSTWTLRNIPGSPGLEGITHGASGYVAVGLLGQITRSADGLTWSSATSGLSMAGELFAGATGPSGTLFAGTAGNVFWSADHLTNWARLDVGTTHSLYGAAYANGRYVIVGGNESTTAALGVVVSSATGGAGSWSKVDINGTGYLAAIAFDSRLGRYVTAGAGNSIYWATDPAGAWTAVTKPTSAVIRAGTGSGGRFVLVGDGGTILHSTDGTTWTAAASPTTVSLQVVAFGGGRFVAGGFDNFGIRSVLVTSTDGVNWQLANTPFTGSIRGIVYADNRFITVGGTSTALASSDGLNWEAETSQFAGLYRAIVRTPAGLVAGGTGGAIASVDAPTATQAVAQRTLGVGTTTAFVPVTGGGRHDPFTYSISPALPPGLVFDPATGAVTGAATNAALTPLFVGADDFNAGSDAKWAYFFRLPNSGTNGEMTFTNGRLDFAKGAGFGTYFLGWDGDRDNANNISRTTASFATSWNYDLTVTNTYTAASGEYADMGIEVAGANVQWAMIRLISRGGSRFVRADRTGGVAIEAPVTATTVRLRLAWDAAAQTLAAQYSTDSGATFTTLTTYAPVSEWIPGSATGGFYFEVVAESNAANAIASGSIYADDLAIASTSAAAAIHTVTVENDVGLRTTNSFLLTIVPAPAITGISPASPTPGAVVTISGSDLAGVTGVTFNGVPATAFSYDPATKTISATLPANVRSGAVVITTPTGSSAGFDLAVPLVITSPPTHTIVTPGMPGSLGVIVAGGSPGTYSYQWRRNGQPITGATRQTLYFPAVSEDDVGEYDVVVTVGSDTVTSGLAAVRTAATDLWTWRNRLPTGVDLSAVAYGAGRYVAVGWAGTLLSSSDGITWAAQPQRPPTVFLNVVFNGTEFAAVGTNGTVLRSANGLDWTVHPLGVAANFRGLAHAFGKWVTTGAAGLIYTSTDGSTWTPRASGVSSSINSVRATATGFIAVTSGGHVLTTDSNATTWTTAATLTGETLIDVGFANGTWVIAANGKVLTSTNGTTWTAATLPTTEPGIAWNRIIANTDGFTIAGATYVASSNNPRGWMIHSTNGTTWTQRTIPFGAGLEGIAHGPSGYVAVGLIGQITRSADGVTWTSPTGGLAMAGELFAGATGPSGTLFAGTAGNVFWSTDHLTNWTRLDVGTANNLYGATYWNGKYVLVGGNESTTAPLGTVVSSPTGAAGTWTKVDLAGTGYLSAITYDTRIARYVTAGAGNSIYWATDPAGSWTAVTKPTSAVIRAGTGSGGRFVLVGDGGTILHSTDGANWSAATSPTTVSLQVVAFGGGRFVAGGFDGNAIRTVLVTSTDGVNWQLANTPFTGSIRGIVYADNRFVTVGGTGSILFSTDGLNWDADTSQFGGLFRGLVRTPVGLVAGGTGGSIASISAPVATPQTGPTLVTVGTAASFNPITVLGGLPPYTYSVSPALPAGLTFDPATGTFSGTPTNAALIPPFAGSDDFNAASTAKWAYFYRLGGTTATNGLLEFTNSRLDFSKGTGPGTYFLGWDGDAVSGNTFYRTGASMVTNWVAEITATNTYNAATGEYADVGFQAAGANSQWASILLLSRDGARFVRTFGSGVSAVEMPVTATTVRLRLSWNVANQALTASFSTDNGATYTTVTTFDTSTWVANSISGGFYFDVFGESNAAAAIPAGALSLDDFSVTPTSQHAGIFVVTVTDERGFRSTAGTVIRVAPAAPVISQAPVATTAIVGSATSLSVTAVSAVPVTYQWLKGTTPVPNGTGATLNFPAVQFADAGSYSVRITNATGSVTSTPVALTVNPIAPVITSASTAVGVVGRNFLYAITTNATSATFSSTTLPGGLSLSSTGVISGIPTTAGTFPVTVTATNATATANREVSLTITAPPPVINSAASATGRAGTPFSFAVTASNTPTSYGATGLPDGLSINATTGEITGTPTVSGTFNVTLSATNAGGTSTSPVLITIEAPLNAPSFTGSPNVSAVQNGTFTFTPAFNNAGLTATYTSTTLPAGLSLNPGTGAITGTPTVTGTFTVDITSTTSGGATTVTFTFTINPPPSAPTITSVSSAMGTVGAPFTFSLAATGTPTSFAVSGLPAFGLSVNAATGLISGTPNAPGTVALLVSATNEVGTGPQSVLILTVNPSPSAPIVSSASVAQGQVGVAFSFPLTATNTPTSFAVVSGTLPAGLTLDTASGVVSGTPTQAGQFTAWVAASNANGAGYSLPMLFAIAPALTTPVITSNGTAAGQVGQPFSYQIKATNTPTSFGATGLPAGFSLDSATGLITGVPSQATTTAIAITLTAANADGSSTPRTLLLTIAPAPATPVITSALTANARVGTAFSYQITATDSASSYVATSLPGGLSLVSATGVISGTPTQSGSFAVPLRAANSAGLGAASTLVLNILPAPTAPAITSAAAVSAKAGVAFTYTITTTTTATGYAVTGTLPLGLALNTSTGVISGTPATSGVHTVQLTATGEGGTSMPQSLVINVSPADNVPVITSAIYAAATVGQDFSYQITAASSPAFPAAPFPAPFTLDAVGLPAGLAVNPSTGLIQGRPTTSGIFTATLVGTNSAGTGPYRDLTIFVAPAPTAPVVTSTPFAAAQVGAPFAYQITATNNPTSFEVIGAPAWMTTNSGAGTLGGTPSSPGTFTVQVAATNTAGTSTPLTVTITVAPSPNAPVITSTRNATGTVSQPFSYTITASVPTDAPAVTAFIATGLPAGLSINPTTGVISGTPTLSGTFEVTLAARNAIGDSQPVVLILTIQPSLQFNLGS